MLWLLSFLVITLVLGTLSVLTDGTVVVPLNETWSASFVFWLMSILLLGCAFLCYRFWQIAKINHSRIKMFAGFASIFMMILVGVLFVLRTMAVFTAFEASVPKQNYTVTATVVVDEISDSVYNKALGTDFRQKAIISNIKLVDNQHKYASNATTTSNPFANENEVVAEDLKDLPKTMTVLLTASASSKQDWAVLGTLVPNSYTQMTLTLSAPKSLQNDGFDGYRWLRTRHIHANARIVSIDADIKPYHSKGITSTLQVLRQTFREYFYQDWTTLEPAKQQAKAVTLSLLTGDRALIDKSTKALYQFAGISHLLAISGTHVVFLAIVLSWFVLALFDRWAMIYQNVSRSTIQISVMLVVSMLYALFTGFDVPAMRTVYMLLAWAVVQKLALPMLGVPILLLVALVMVWLDPFVLWQAGFWLSFVAVLLLMSYQNKQPAQASIKQRITALIQLQIWLFLAMLPLSMWLFGKVSLWGLFVNLFAVGLFGMVIVPLNLLAGLLFGVLPSLASFFWGLSTTILWLLHQLLVMLAQMGGNIWLYDVVGAVGVGLGMMVLVALMLPALGKRFAIVPMMAMGFVISNLDKHHQMLIKVLPSQDSVSLVLIQQKDADPNSVNGWANWLLMADFGTTKMSHRFTNELVDTLKKHRINHLTGVIVQTADSSLSLIVPQLHQHIPISRFWQAGQSSTHSMSIPTTSCQSGQQWQGDGLSVQALTGWMAIADSHVWGCSVAFDSVRVPKMQGVDTLDLPSQSSYRVVVDGVTHERTWQLYALMCPVSTTKIDVWLTNSHGVFANHQMLEQSFAPKQVLLTNQISEQ